MPTLSPYLVFDGRCAEAMRFYAKTFGGALNMTTFGESPEPSTPQTANLIMHASLTLGSFVLMAADCPPGLPFQKAAGISLALGLPTVEEARRVFDALAEGGRVTMPFDSTFWAEGFGMLVDRYEISWMVNVEAPKA